MTSRRLSLYDLVERARVDILDDGPAGWDIDDTNLQFQNRQIARWLDDAQREMARRVPKFQSYWENQTLRERIAVDQRVVNIDGGNIVAIESVIFVPDDGTRDYKLNRRGHDSVDGYRRDDLHTNDGFYNQTDVTRRHERSSAYWDFHHPSLCEYSTNVQCDVMTLNGSPDRAGELLVRVRTMPCTELAWPTSGADAAANIVLARAIYPDSPAQYHEFLPIWAAAQAYRMQDSEVCDPNRAAQLEGEWDRRVGPAMSAAQLDWYERNEADTRDGSLPWGLS